ncbi:glycosyltransferase [Ilumatobacter sp.]|uniref:glycosyltransferase n=1 Tax=Ilumatobacter sp. TaxID=1967498 RepID=UPI003B52EA87
MRIALAVPARPGAHSGNSITGERWARRLTQLGHDAEVVGVVEGDADSWLGAVDDDGIDVLVALHARRCAEVVAWSASHRSDRAIVVGLAGTDLYRDLPDSAEALASLRCADHLVVLQAEAIDHLAGIEPAFADKASVVHQSVEVDVGPVRRAGRGEPDDEIDGIDGDEAVVVAVLAHLRDVKAPLLAARAARELTESSHVRVEHAGSTHDARWRDAAEREMAENPRYVWHGPLEPPAARLLLTRASALACTSRLEGGANVVSEAIAHGVAVVGTDIAGNRGLLGADHPGLVPVDDHGALARVLHRLETRPDFAAELRGRSVERRWMTDPAHERRQWADVIAALPDRTARP